MPAAQGLPFYEAYDHVLDETAKHAQMHGGRVLDVGCGTGNLSERLTAAGLSVEGGSVIGNADSGKRKAAGHASPSGNLSFPPL
ncbi:MAG: hypothetical protein ACLRRB_01450 [Ruminococcus sp.]